MERDATDWLEKHHPGRFVPDRLRPIPLVEKIGPGDVTDSGSILSAGGFYVAMGTILLTERKADAAAYYGWRRVLGSPLSKDRDTGEILYPMGR